jgi:hypothetical protein
LPNFNHNGTPTFPSSSARIGGTRLVELRLETFNLFNRAHVGLPERAFGAGNFGRISDTRFPSREIQVGVRFFF